MIRRPRPQPGFPEDSRADQVRRRILPPDDGEKVNISDTELRKLTLSKAQAASLVNDNQEVFTEAVEAALTKEDVVALGYRKKQVQTFGRLLSEPDYFDQAKASKQARGDEALWQMFFEKNQWIFGYGLSYFFVTGFENKKLEQVVEGILKIKPNNDKPAAGGEGAK